MAETGHYLPIFIFKQKWYVEALKQILQKVNDRWTNIPELYVLLHYRDYNSTGFAFNHLYLTIFLSTKKSIGILKCRYLLYLFSVWGFEHIYLYVQKIILVSVATLLHSSIPASCLKSNLKKKRKKHDQLKFSCLSTFVYIDDYHLLCRSALLCPRYRYHVHHKQGRPLPVHSAEQ